MTEKSVSNIDFAGIADLIENSEYVQICGHTSPDGDCISSQLAMRRALIKMGKNVDVLLSLNEKAPIAFEFLDGYDELVFCGKQKKEADLFIMIDVPNDKRLGHSAAKLKNKATTVLKIDHHAESEKYSDFSFIDESAASTTVIVWELLGEMGGLIDEQIALACLTGLMTDTGNFQYQNADLRAFSCATEMVKMGANSSLISENVYMRRSLESIKLVNLAVDKLEVFCDGRAAVSCVTRKDIESCGATKNDCDSIISLLRSIDGTKLVAVLREDDNFVKVSFRSLETIDCRELASLHGGGGHAGAAGATLDVNLDSAKKIIMEEMRAALEEQECLDED